MLDLFFFLESWRARKLEMVTAAEFFPRPLFDYRNPICHSNMRETAGPLVVTGGTTEAAILADWNLVYRPLTL